MVSVRRRLQPQAGYNLVFLVMLVGLLGVMAAAVLPSLKSQIQREKEAELIFRGLQYAEAIRVFQQRFGRYPTVLEELVELQPRSIRQLWTDPLSEDGRWALILASAAPQQNPDGESEDQAAAGRNVAQGAAPTSSFQRTGGSGAQLSAGPILGVVSRAKGVAQRTFMGKELYEEWRFTANILPKPQIVPGTEILVRASVEFLGKPFPRGLKAPGLGAGTDPTDLSGGNVPSDLFDDEEDDG